MSDSAESLKNLSSEAKRSLLVKLLQQKRTRARTFPLSFAQQRLWFLSQLAPGNPFYNVPAALRLRGQLDVAALHSSLNAIVERHEVLRTTFQMSEGQPSQLITPTLRLPFPLLELSTLAPEEREAAALRLANEEARHPFDLACGPLLRTSLLRLGEQDHVLLLTMHHIVCDGWSMGLFFRELSSLYTAFVDGHPSPLPPLPIQYADFAVWQRDWLQGEVLSNQLGYWRRQLADLTPLQLPTDRPHPPLPSFRGASHYFTLPEQLSAALRQLSRREGVTLFMTLLTAFQLLLHRYSGQDDIVVGAPIANRNRAEIEALIGFFVNTLVLRTNLAGNPTFRELLARVREVALEAYAHQDLPFEMLVEELQPERDLSRNPLFQVTFQLLNAPRGELNMQNLQVTSLGLAARTAKFDIALGLWEDEQILAGRLEYSTDLFEAATIARLVGHFSRLLEGIVAAPDARLADLPLLSTAERQQLLLDWNATSAPYPHETPLHQLIEAQVARTPDALAVAAEQGQLSYAELNRRANGLAHHLQQLGVRPDTLVGLYMERSLAMVVALLAILKAGGAYVPLDPTSPAERLHYMLADAGLSLVISQPELAERLPASGLQVLYLRPDGRGAGAEREENPVSAVRARHLAYVIYTSGSTGRPKGVMIEHDGLINLLDWHQFNYHVTNADRATQLASPAFDASAWEIWPYLVAGASIHIPDDQTRVSPLELLDWLANKKITIAFLPTPLAAAILDLVWPPAMALRVLLTGGEKLLQGPKKKLSAHLFNHYGPTESTVVATWAPVALQTKPGPPPPIGRPIANTEVYVLDRYMQPVPIGVPGELHIGGVGLARGYLNRPQLTAEKFIPNPFSTSPDARLYKTGDLVRYLPDGDLEFLGRLDQQVKIRGLRVELGEIEAVLAEHPAVREAAVVARENPPSNIQLCAYVVPDPEYKDGEDLRHFLQEKLPAYMIPSSFVSLEALPITPNGKLDRPALSALDNAQSVLVQHYVAPRTTLEETLAGIWAEVFQVEQIGINDNFFTELGGHSLLGTQLLSRVRSTLKVEVPLRSLFEAPTVSSFARVVARYENRVQDPNALIIHHIDNKSEDQLATQVARLSDEEVDTLLCDLLDGKEF
jgi:amino acid adenylation domain-containing protein